MVVAGKLVAGVLPRYECPFAAGVGLEVGFGLGLEDSAQTLVVAH